MTPFRDEGPIPPWHEEGRTDTAFEKYKVERRAWLETLQPGMNEIDGVKKWVNGYVTWPDDAPEPGTVNDPNINHMEEIVRELPLIIFCPHCDGKISTEKLVSRELSADLILRRLLAENAIQDAAKAEVMARPYEKPGWDRDFSPTEWQRWMTSADYNADADRAQSMWAWLNDEEAQKRSYESREWHRRASKEADLPARDREAELLAFSRMPNWETDEPPPLTPEQAAVLAKHMATGEDGAAMRALAELRGGR